MARMRLTLSIALAFLVNFQATQGATKLRAILTNAGEPGGVTPTSSMGGPRPASFGTAIFELNDAQDAMTMWATIHNIDFGGQTPDEANDNLTAAHIHGSAADPPPATRPVVWGFLGAPDNDNNPDNLVVTPFVNKAGAIVTSTWNAAEGNSGTTLAAQLDNILNGRTYLNIHTSQFGGGEIRGTLEVIPEPATSVLLAFSASLLIVRRRKR